MKEFCRYADRLGELVDLAVSSRMTPRLHSAVKSALDGQPYRVLRRTVQLSDLRSKGTFFTSSLMARTVAASIAALIGKGARVFDPTCGAGDLLLACTDFLPARTRIRSTVHEWSERIGGFDIDPEFVRVTKYRLVLKALLRSVRRDGCVSRS